jgi:hypothetical protein
VIRVTTLPIEGDAEPFDPENPGPFAAMAGTQLVRLEGDAAVVHDEEGREHVIYPGGLAIRPDGSGDGEVLFTTQTRFAREGRRRLWGLAGG